MRTHPNILSFYEIRWNRREVCSNVYPHTLTVMVDPVLTIRDVAEFLKLSQKTVYAMAKSGKLPAFKVGSQWRIRRDDLEDWITSRAAKDHKSGRVRSR